MKKEMVILISLSLILILLVAPISAGWFSDFWNKITGKAVNPNEVSPFSTCPQSQCSLTTSPYCVSETSYKYCAQVDNSVSNGDFITAPTCRWNIWKIGTCAAGQICSNGNCVTDNYDLSISIFLTKDSFQKGEQITLK